MIDTTYIGPTHRFAATWKSANGISNTRGFTTYGAAHQYLGIRARMEPISEAQVTRLDAYELSLADLVASGGIAEAP